MKKTLLFNRSSFEKQLDMNDYIEAVSYAHQLHAEGNIIETNLIHADAPNGEYHIKSGGIIGEKSYYGLKANGGFFNNQNRYNLPNILGIIYLSDAENAYPLAIFESSLISKMRTAAATAVAARYLQPKDPIHLGIIGYGNQAEAQIEALLCVCDVKSIKISGRNQQKLIEFAKKIKDELFIPVNTSSLENTCKNSNIIITCTPSTKPFVNHEWIQPGTFIGAIGADSPGKNELDPKIIQNSKIIGDIKNQIIKVGESQHAIKNNLILPKDIYGELGELITGKIKGRTNDKEIFVYDSTGTAIQDIACAAFIYKKLKNEPNIAGIDFFG
ncbi:ornithine cyclodeaminase family protein [Aquimarina megaterium]|uniref:ornithine cyclodeaminase family protein n=1 Tax=Aquimarina megaterium TaxID=1443666 RepID=UPI000942BC89|nr:ornithine cyclodeaminase family protein [Aquimarina megaterium]